MGKNQRVLFCFVFEDSTVPLGIVFILNGDEEDGEDKSKVEFEAMFTRGRSPLDFGFKRSAENPNLRV